MTKKQVEYIIKKLDEHHLENVIQHVTTRTTIDELKNDLKTKADAPDRDAIGQLIKDGVL
jgi:hypothetical protein